MRGARVHSPRSLAVLALVACALVPLLGGCTIVRAILCGEPMPEVTLRGIHLEQLRLDGVTVRLDVEVTNPYSLPLPIVNARYGLTAHGHRFISGETQIHGSVPAHGSKIISVPVDVSFVRLIGAAAQVRPGMVIPYEADVTLSLDTPIFGVIDIPISKEGELPVPAVPTIHLARIEWKRLGLNRAEAVLHLTVTNTNDFPLTIKELTYALKLGGISVIDSRMTQTEQLDAKETKTIEIQVALSPLKLGLAAIRILEGRDASYAIQGSLDVDTPFGRLHLPYTSRGRTRLSKSAEP